MKLLICILLLPMTLFSQSITDFNQERLKMDEQLMLGLGSWSLANVAVSGYGWAKTNGEAKYFHQMNVMWSGVNLVLAIPGWIKARKNDPKSFSFAETWRLQNKTEKIFLFNTGVDLFYITGGFLLKQRALIDALNYHRYRGWGNSLILQGSFLFLFDLSATLLHSRHRQKKMENFLEKIQFSSYGIGFKYQFS